MRSVASKMPFFSTNKRVEQIPAGHYLGMLQGVTTTAGRRGMHEARKPSRPNMVTANAPVDNESAQGKAFNSCSLDPSLVARGRIPYFRLFARGPSTSNNVNKHSRQGFWLLISLKRSGKIK